MNRPIMVLLVLSAVVIVEAKCSAAARYRVMDLGNTAYPSDVNDSGWVVGRHDVPSMGTCGFIWRESTGFTDLPGTTNASAVSRDGRVVGWNTPASLVSNTAWVWKDGLLQSLPSFRPCEYPYAVNSTGVRVTGIRTVEKVTLQYGVFVNGEFRFAGETLYLPVGAVSRRHPSPVGLVAPASSRWKRCA
jgi:hypothetical protein